MLWTKIKVRVTNKREVRGTYTKKRIKKRLDAVVKFEQNFQISEDKMNSIIPSQNDFSFKSSF